MKRVLVLGGTGAMGVYLVPKLAGMGYKVDVAASQWGARYQLDYDRLFNRRGRQFQSAARYRHAAKRS